MSRAGSKAEHPSGLTLRAQKCVEYYLEHCEKEAAYAHAFGRGTCKKNTFSQKVAQFFSQPKVLAEIRRRRDALSSRTDVKVEDVVRRLYQFGFTDMPGIVHFDGTVMRVEDFDNLTAAQRAAIKKFQFEQDPPTEVKGADGEVTVVPGKAFVKIEMHDQIPAVVKIGQHLGMWEKKPKAAIVDNRPVILFNNMPSPTGKG